MPTASPGAAAPPVPKIIAAFSGTLVKVNPNPASTEATAPPPTVASMYSTNPHFAAPEGADAKKAGTDPLVLDPMAPLDACIGMDKEKDKLSKELLF